MVLLIFPSLQWPGSRYRTGPQAVDSGIKILPCGEGGRRVYSENALSNSEPTPLSQIEVAASTGEIRWRKMLAVFRAADWSATIIYSETVVGAIEGW